MLGLMIALLFAPVPASAHGGVVEEDDLCVINIGYLKAHFKIYVPAKRQHEQFCEDLPVGGESVFVMEYLHEGLSSAEIDFRIIENVTGKGTFARLEDVERLPDLEAVTVRYEPARIVPDVYTLLHEFDADGEFVGIVSAASGVDGEVYTAVFPFEVGYTGIGQWPWIVAAIALLQLNYWHMSRRRKLRLVSTVILLALAVAPRGGVQAAEMGPVQSRDGHFLVRFVPGIEPLRINHLHSWTLVIATVDSAPVRGANIRITGGMPAHDHGLPTAPAVVDADEDGRYVVKGMRFHMSGDWELLVEIDDGTRRDLVVLPITLEDR